MAQPPEATLYVIPGSHPAMVARRMLELKGIPYKRVDLMPVISRGALRALRFPSNTVPSLKIDGQEADRARARSARELDRIRPEPALYPPDARPAGRGRGCRALGRRGSSRRPCAGSSGTR